MLGISRPFFTLRVAARFCETLALLCTANHEIKKKESGTRLFSDVRLLSMKLQELFYHGAAVAVNDDRAVLDLHRADSFAVIQAGVDR